MTPPDSEEELFARAEAMAGQSLAMLAESVEVAVPPDMKRHKGWIGNLIERVLGATAASRDEPDFESLGVELKTIPIDRGGRPLETTFVATVPLAEVGEVPWERSRVRRKLARVLWVPILGLREIAPGDRRVGAPLLWSPSEDQEAMLRRDWEELAGMIGRGDIERITGRFGRYLQVRPKAAHGAVRRRSIDTEGRMIETLPRGFYLRTQFTAQILRDTFALPAARLR